MNYYTEHNELEKKVINKAYNQIKFFEQVIPKKVKKIAIKYGIL